MVAKPEAAVPADTRMSAIRACKATKRSAAVAVADLNRAAADAVLAELKGAGGRGLAVTIRRVDIKEVEAGTARQLHEILSFGQTNFGMAS